MPKRLLKVKRIYALGQYQNVEFTDEISELDTSVVTEEAAYLINMLQLLGMEKMINKYLSFRGTISDQNMTPENAIAYLDETKAEIIKEMKQILPKDAQHTIITKGD